MAGELGQATDPAGLIPGDPAEASRTAATLAAYGDVLRLAGAGLARIDTSEGWRGAAADAFHRVYRGQPGQWVRAGDAFHDAAAALAAYVTVLVWAHGQAAVAIRTWQSGPAHHQAAVETLEDARSWLDSAGNTAAGLVGRARDLAPPAPGFWSQAGSFVAGAGRDAEVVGAGVIDGLLSLGNAVLHHPGAVAAVAAGALLAEISAGGDAGGLALDATGVGAVAGVPLNVVSTAGVIAGLGISAAGLGTILTGAAGPQSVSMMSAQIDSRLGAGEVPRSYASSPGKIARQTGYTEKQVRDAIHEVKEQRGWRNYSDRRTPDVTVDTSTGEVFPKLADGTPAGDSIGNIYDYLPDEP